MWQSLATRPRKSLLSISDRKILAFSMPRPITWWRAPGASSLGCLGMTYLISMKEYCQVASEPTSPFAVKRYRTLLDLQILQFVEARKQFFVAQLYNLPTQPLAREESKIRSKKIRHFPLERCQVLSLHGPEWEKLHLNQRPGSPSLLLQNSRY